MPPVELLTPPSDQDVDAGEAQLDRLGNSLIETLRTFKVEGRPGPRTTGPVVTQFEVVPAPGVKAGRIGSLADDLAIAMRVPSSQGRAHSRGRAPSASKFPIPPRASSRCASCSSHPIGPVGAPFFP